MTSPPRHSPLHEFHLLHRARMTEFSGWAMPVHYSSIMEEHRAVRKAAGMFDVSHMGEIDVVGPDAAVFLNKLVTNDVSKLQIGRVLYTPMCWETGGVIDDLLVYMRAEGHFFLCVNASNTTKDLEWLKANVGSHKVAIHNRSDDFALLALQGPNSQTILQSLSGVELKAIRYYHFVVAQIADVPCLVSRTGYTGEDGFELYHSKDDSPRLATRLLESGEPQSLKLAGLASRDSLRLEAGFPLYGHEIDDTISPIAAGLGWTVKLEKSVEFSGASALREEKRTKPSRQIIFFSLEGRRIAREGSPILDLSDRVIGVVRSGTFSPILNKPIGSALIERTGINESLRVKIHDEKVALSTVKPPFVKLPPKI